MTDDKLDPYERLVSFNYLWRKFYIPAMEEHSVLEKAVKELKDSRPLGASLYEHMKERKP